MTRIKKLLKNLFRVGIIAMVTVCVCLYSINYMVKAEAGKSLLFSFIGNDETNDENFEKNMDTLTDFAADCIIVLGAGIEDECTPTPMLKDRLDTGIELYNQGAASKILLTGDNGQVGHNEIHVMLKYVKEAGVPSEDIFCDHAGFSTYDSMYRAIDIFQVKKAIVVTQKYHEYRAIYIAQKLGLEVLGVSSDQDSYIGQFARDIREVLARNKDFFKVRSGAAALLSGEVIPISGSGLVSHGE